MLSDALIGRLSAFSPKVSMNVCAQVAKVAAFVEVEHVPKKACFRVLFAVTAAANCTAVSKKLSTCSALN